MRIVSITTELNKCLRFTKSEDDLVLCLNYAFEKTPLFENDDLIMLPKEDAFILKKMLIRYIYEKNLNLNVIFKKLWWNKNKEINVVAAYFISDLFYDPDQIDSVFFRQVLDRLKSWDLTTTVSEILENIIMDNLDKWNYYVDEIIKLNNKWALRLAALIIGKIAIVQKELIPELLSVLMLLMRSKDWEVQQSINWCLRNMAGVWSEPVMEFTNVWEHNFQKKIILN